MTPMKSALAALGWTLAASGAALAAPTTFIPNADHTFVRFSYDHLGFSTQQSRFNKTTGTVTLDAAARTGSVDLVIDTKSGGYRFGSFQRSHTGRRFSRHRPSTPRPRSAPTPSSSMAINRSASRVT